MTLLHHVTVLDFSTTLPGPYCTMLLANFGANVIKIERPGTGDIMREWYPWIFHSVNRNKRSMVLDLKSEEGRVAVYQMAEKADVVVEGFRPGVMDRLGIGFEKLKTINSRLIYCSISGFGQTGPYRDFPGHDINYLGIAGALGLAGRPEEDPERGHVQKVPYSDFGAGIFAATAILACLNARERKAVHLDISITDIIHSWVLLKAANLLLGNDPVPEPHYGVFRTKDGGHVALGIIEDHFWEAFCRAMGLDDWLNDSSLAAYSARVARHREILPRVREIVAAWNRDELVKVLLEAGVPCTPIHTIADTLEDPQLRERGILTPVPNADASAPGEEGLADRYILNVPFAGMPLAAPGKSPGLGEHTEEIMREFGIR